MAIQASAQAPVERTDAEQAHARYVLSILFLLFTLSYVDRQIIGILATPIKRELNLNDTQLGLLGGLSFALLYCTLAVPIALLADRRRRTIVLAVALSLWSVFTALCGLATGFVMLMFCRLGVGIGEAGGTAPSYSLIADYFPPRERARALSIFHLGVPIGSALGLLIGGFVAARWGWRSAFVIAGAGGLILAPLIWFTVREPKRGQYDPVPTAGVGSAPHSLRDVLRHLATRPSFWFMSLGGATGAMLLYGYGFWFPTFFQRSHGLDIGTTSLVVAGLVVTGGASGNLLGGWLGDTLGQRARGAYAYVPAVAFIVALPLTLAGLFVSDLRLAIPLLLAPQACSMIASSPIGVATQAVGPVSMRTTLSAIYLFIVSLIGLGAGTLLFGTLSDVMAQHFGADSLRYAMLTSAAVLHPLTALLYFLGGRRLARDWYVEDASR
jgi:predicted MFS family arabinose efflux permease